MLPRPFSPELPFLGGSSCPSKPFPVYSLATGPVTITKQITYKSFVLISFRIPHASTCVFSYTSAHSQKNRGEGAPASCVKLQLEACSPLVTRHSPLLCATLPSQRKRLCDPHVPASRSSSSSFSSAHRTGMRVRWRLCGPVGPAEPDLNYRIARKDAR